MRCPWCNGYRRRKWARWQEFKSWVIYIYILDTYRRNDNRHMINDRRTQKDRRKKDGRRKENAGRFLYKYFTSHFIARFEKGYSKFACERVLETEHKLHILTPLLRPSRCVFIVLLMLGSTPSGLSEGPLGLVWPSLPHLVSNPLVVCWQLHRGFPRSPSVERGLPYHISSLTLWESAGNCIGGFRGPPRSVVAFPITSRL